jgi:hypothetical protein
MSRLPVDVKVKVKVVQHKARRPFMMRAGASPPPIAPSSGTKKNYGVGAATG